MIKTSQKVEQRIASLPIAKSEREKAIAYVSAGESLANALIAMLNVFSTRSTPVLNHS